MFRCFFIFILNVSAVSCAFGQSNTLVVFSAAGKRFLLTLNGEAINSVPQSNVKAFSIGPGRQHLRVDFREDKDQAVLVDSFVIGRHEKYADKEFTYALTDELKNGHIVHTLHFVTVSDTSGPEKPHVPQAPKEIVPLVDNSIYGILYQAKNNKPVFFDHYDDDNRTCDTALSDKDLAYLDHLLSKTNDIEAKYNDVMQTIRNNCYSTQQLKRLVTLLPLELDKLKACKEGYWHLTDRQHAPDLSSALVYKTLQEDYQNYLDELASIDKQQQMKCTDPMTPSEFEKLTATIKAAPYENDRVRIAKKQVVKNCLSTGQLRDVAGLFTHDRDKLDLIKATYRVVTDKPNFYKLSDVFLFSETKEEFNKYFSK